MGKTCCNNHKHSNDSTPATITFACNDKNDKKKLHDAIEAHNKMDYGVVLTRIDPEKDTSHVLQYTIASNPYGHSIATIRQQLGASLEQTRSWRQHIQLYWRLYIAGSSALALWIGMRWLTLGWHGHLIMAAGIFAITTLCLWPFIQKTWPSLWPMLVLLLGLASVFVLATILHPLWLHGHLLVFIAGGVAIALIGLSFRKSDMHTAQLLSLAILLGADIFSLTMPQLGLPMPHWCHFLIIATVLLLGHHIQDIRPKQTTVRNNDNWRKPLKAKVKSQQEEIPVTQLQPAKTDSHDSKYTGDKCKEKSCCPHSESHARHHKTNTFQFEPITKERQDNKPLEPITKERQDNKPPFMVMPTHCTANRQVWVPSRYIDGETGTKVKAIEAGHLLRPGWRVYASDPNDTESKKTTSDLTFEVKHGIEKPATDVEGKTSDWMDVIRNNAAPLMLILATGAGVYAWLVGHSVVLAICSMLLCACPCCVFGIGPNLIEAIAVGWLNDMQLNLNAHLRHPLDTLDAWAQTKPYCILDKTGTLTEERVAADHGAQKTHQPQVRTTAKDFLKKLRPKVSDMWVVTGDLTFKKNKTDNENKLVKNFAHETALQQDHIIYAEPEQDKKTADPHLSKWQWFKGWFRENKETLKNKTLLWLADGENDGAVFGKLKVAAKPLKNPQTNTVKALTTDDKTFFTLWHSNNTKLVACSMPQSYDSVRQHAHIQMDADNKNPLASYLTIFTIARRVRWLRRGSMMVGLAYIAAIVPISLMGWLNPMTSCALMCGLSAFFILMARFVVPYLCKPTMPILHKQTPDVVPPPRAMHITAGSTATPSLSPKARRRNRQSH